MRWASQHIDAEDRDAVLEVLQSEWLTQGPRVAAFEQRVAEYCGARHAVAVFNGTAALYVACRALGIGPGDSVWTSPNSFVASANCAVLCGAQAGFVDVEPDSHNLSPADLDRKLELAAARNALPKAVIATHYGGQPCDLQRISNLLRKHKIQLVEDAAHALGATYRTERTGACGYSDLTIFSFHASKSIATGEGGMILTNDDSLYEQLIVLRNHGIVRDADPAQPWSYRQEEIGFNWRMTELQAALGLSQMRKLEHFLTRRRELAARYDSALKDLPLQLPYRNGESSSSWHLYAINVDGPGPSRTRLRLYNALKENGIASQVHYIPIHTQPFYQARGFRQGDFPKAEAHYHSTLTLPMFYDLRDAAQDRIISVVRETLKPALVQV